MIGLPLALFTLWQLGPTGAAPFITPYLIYSLFVVFLLPAPRRQTVQRSKTNPCEVTGGTCDPSYAWSAPRLAKMLDEIREALGAPIDATHAEVLARIALLQAGVGEPL